MTRGEKVCSQICSRSSFGKEENEVSDISKWYGPRGKVKCKTLRGFEVGRRKKGMS